ncbi:MAG: hypothetical protein FIA97_04595 [Methylococcaceae bacterium]|nr:hypothetical protein [Methylococcaceae bacterium]
MVSLDTTNRLLSVAADLIDRAASEIRDGKVEPVRENIELLGRALAEIFTVQHRIYESRPDLTPDYLKEPSEHSEANRSLMGVMFRASEFERVGDIAGAIAEFERFLQIEPSTFHTEIAAGEIQRLKDGARP